MTKIKRVREAALEILEATEKEQAYSNLMLNKTIEKYQLSSVDSALLTEITYGTLQRKITLDFYLQPFIKKQKRIENWVKQLLRLSVYQIAFLTKIPDRAIFHEAVEIAKKRGHKGISGFVNGVLRSIQRNGLPSLETINDPIERLSVETSHPLWLIKRWVEQYGFNRTREMCLENLHAPKQTARVNENLTTVEEVIRLLQEEGYAVEKSEHIPVAIRSLRGNIAKSKIYSEGYLTIQDESSMIVGYAVSPKEDDTVLDACAAPGGKTTHMAEKMRNRGTVFALDLHEHKVKLIEQNSHRLKLTNINALQMDSRLADKHFTPDMFDKVLVDAPCSGLGVLKRKPDIKYTKTEEDVKRLAEIQLQLLDHASVLVKHGGLLVYSTCTVDKEENEEVAKKFLETHPDFVPDHSVSDRVPDQIKPFVKSNQIEILPQDFYSDGFYIACFKKKE